MGQQVLQRHKHQEKGDNRGDERGDRERSPGTQEEGHKLDGKSSDHAFRIGGTLCRSQACVFCVVQDKRRV